MLSNNLGVGDMAVWGTLTVHVVDVDGDYAFVQGVNDEGTIAGWAHHNDLVRIA